MSANAARRLIQHYVDNYRRLPWREPPGATLPDPYRVWVSEIMLQQTTVAAVTPQFARFIERWPTVESLAAAADEEVLDEWAGLGYYARARNLFACARKVVEIGGFPRTEAELLRLPGVGNYTAAAIAAIAFGEHTAVVDTNVTRVVARLHRLSEPDQSEIRALTLAMTPADHPGDFAQAIMDIGATVCTVRSPKCGLCPVRECCAAFASGEPQNFPLPKARKAKPLRRGIAYWTERDGHIWLVRRPAKGLLGGMAALPGSDWTADHPCAAAAIATVRHVFTHFTLDLHIVPTAQCHGDGWWQPVTKLHEAGLPTLYLKAVEAFLKSDRKLAA